MPNKTTRPVITSSNTTPTKKISVSSDMELIRASIQGSATKTDQKQSPSKRPIHHCSEERHSKTIKTERGVEPCQHPASEARAGACGSGVSPSARYSPSPQSSAGLSSPPSTPLSQPSVRSLPSGAEDNFPMVDSELQPTVPLMLSRLVDTSSNVLANRDMGVIDAAVDAVYGTNNGSGSGQPSGLDEYERSQFSEDEDDVPQTRVPRPHIIDKRGCVLCNVENRNYLPISSQSIAELRLIMHKGVMDGNVNEAVKRTRERYDAMRDEYGRSARLIGKVQQYECLPPWSEESIYDHFFQHSVDPIFMMVRVIDETDFILSKTCQYGMVKKRKSDGVKSMDIPHATLWRSYSNDRVKAIMSLHKMIGDTEKKTNFKSNTSTDVFWASAIKSQPSPYSNPQKRR
jgi:hypothetical protein